MDFNHKLFLSKFISFVYFFIVFITMKQLYRPNLWLGRLRLFKAIHLIPAFHYDSLSFRDFSTFPILQAYSAKISNTPVSAKNSSNVRSYPSVSTSINQLISSIPSRIQPLNSELSNLVAYQLTSSGKHIRPTLVWLISRLVYPPSSNTQSIPFDSHARLQSPSSIPSRPNAHISINEAQDTIARVCELIHTASLVHDDLLDSSDTRRGRPSVQQRFSHCHVIFLVNPLFKKLNNLIIFNNCAISLGNYVWRLSNVSQHPNVSTTRPVRCHRDFSSGFSNHFFRDWIFRTLILSLLVHP